MLDVSKCHGFLDHLADDPLQLLLGEVLVDLDEDLPEPPHGDEPLPMPVEQPMFIRPKIFFCFP